jgi:hypothetical protein
MMVFIKKKITMFFFNIIFFNIFILKKFHIVIDKKKKRCFNLATIEHPQERYYTVINFH